MNKILKRAILVIMIWAVIAVVTLMAIELVRRFYPDYDKDEVNEKIELIESYGEGDLIDITESGVLIEKRGNVYMIIRTPKMQILSALYDVFIAEGSLTIVIVAWIISNPNYRQEAQQEGHTEKEKGR